MEDYFVFCIVVLCGHDASQVIRGMIRVTYYGSNGTVASGKLAIHFASFCDFCSFCILLPSSGSQYESALELNIFDEHSKSIALLLDVGISETAISASRF
jgi:hypothetical protein